MRVGLGFDAHRLVEGRPLFLGGVEVPYEKGLLGHSDADVALHALMDALLGAASLGNIGEHFPPGDEKYKDISSIVLLEKVREMVKERGYLVDNVDVVIICDEPKLSPFFPQMRKRIAETLLISEDKVSVKATTVEGMGFIGRGEGIAAQAVVLIERRS
jgi:2-C-methyl-D-erythritol 2,4-cyclodiphosphate synthase